MSNPLPHDTIVPFGDEKRSKKEQVADMFDQIAFRYDFLNRFLSGGIDVYWRKKAIGKLKSLKPRQVLDVATGTGDVALMTMKYLNPDKITGIDISAGMLDFGRKKIARAGLADRIELMQADSENLPFPDNSFDAVTVAFGVRNFEHLHKGLSEMLRVLKPGGKLVVLEFSKPKATWFKSLYTFYMNIVTPGIGKLFSKNKDAYQYLNDSVKAFPEGQDFTDILGQTGYTDTGLERLSLGISTIYTGTKPLL
ncbi:bifunctional demethylmenaquinone methyltransferase/2-methoxy-6-polyprenyl-1,4-benzoquinol methylase UbiE [Flavihumibacter stibioxidans]|uniref:Demethylmenaquinone methyltransferase n=1 Tax=Flavihumibacter stibioxidans TaxID=1834163 RepID=A0ABR7M7R6_9BACT|nr:bifunctional demethylmenaquinone methyltransferase/2-methoxy-6-polyprenyl-1,4-benzoquinol methylase UbiE [Flavihumibacter stibioxidans]MBC6490765.1 bifunctional demethylmenaquinone methyltransferase/2-methoxy-6-polyprenyl-1,4-benzoquinol methylase [Flavihumibacter stibioxidans]